MRPSTALLLTTLAAAIPLSGCAVVAGGAAATGALMIEDRRSAGTYLVDEEIELKAAGRLNDARIEGVHANFTSFNRRVLITGEVPTEAVKAQVAEMVRGLPNVREIANELAVAAPTSLGSRTGDGYVTAKIKTRFLDDKRFAAHHVKVVTENGVAYLMGMVKRAEGTAAGEVAARTSGVTRVVKVFEYLD
jgi:osmotically-inducible protein OsmY